MNRIIPKIYRIYEVIGFCLFITSQIASNIFYLIDIYNFIYSRLYGELDNNRFFQIFSNKLFFLKEKLSSYNCYV